MGSIRTQMPPTLAKPWDFGTWDYLEDEVPPWQHRGFWYHDECGSGDILVIAWRYSFDEGGYMVVSGYIHRFDFEKTPSAKTLWDYYRRQIDENTGFGPDGVFIFEGRCPGCARDIYGKPLPTELQCLPDNRWL